MIIILNIGISCVTIQTCLPRSRCGILRRTLFCLPPECEPSSTPGRLLRFLREKTLSMFTTESRKV